MPVNMCAAPLICARAPGANPDLQAYAFYFWNTLAVGGPCSSFMVTSPRCYVGLVCMGGTLPGMMGTCQTVPLAPLLPHLPQPPPILRPASLLVGHLLPVFLAVSIRPLLVQLQARPLQANLLLLSIASGHSLWQLQW
ncbi:hypothetical protein BASA83_005501 [Batrachochytrium salamandrivorans]|nr:hypothetical protein BASA83_005501 [Batrachochytrium salamandrivorans]